MKSVRTIGHSIPSPKDPISPEVLNRSDGESLTLVYRSLL